jgi:hypothetical protein
MVIYRERQRWTQPWLWAVILGGTALIWYGAYRQIVRGDPWGSNPAGDGLLVIVWVVVGVVLPSIFLFGGLTTEVRSNGIYVRFAPFHLRWRGWEFDEIEGVELRRYSPLREYGGWGIRVGQRGWAYNVRGNMGVQLTLRTGERMLIGTQDPSGLLAAIDHAVAERT